LRAVRLHTPCRWIANLVEEHVGPNHTYAILEYCNGGSLMRHLQKMQAKGQRGNPLSMSEPDVAHLGAQVNAALLHLHRLDVAHRDLKPGNVLFYGNDGNHLKLCDFGFAKRCRGQRLHTICGTPIYMAPELTQESKKGYVGQPVDMWAFGALLYEMLHNRIAFTGVSEQQLYQRIRGGNHGAMRKDLSKEVKALIKGLLSPDPASRWSAEKTAAHPFFARVDSLDSHRDELEV
jgi:serine/threonine protein kinase